MDKLRQNATVISLTVFTVMLAFLAIFTTAKLKSLKPIAPTVPQATPLAAGPSCQLSFTVGGTPTPTPTPGGTPTPTPTPTPSGSPTPTPSTACWQQCVSDSQCGTGRICKEISGAKRCVNSKCETEPDCVCNASCQGSCGANNECSSGQICRNYNNAMRCVNPNCLDDNDCNCTTVQATPTPPIPVTPKAGSFLPTAAAVLGGVILLIFGLAL